MSSIVKKDYWRHAWPLMISGIFAQWDLSIRQVYQNTCLVCAHVYVGCKTVLMNISQKVIVVRYRKCDTIPQNTPFMFSRALKRVTMSKYPQSTRSIKKYVGNWALASTCISSKKLSLHWQLPRKSSCCVPMDMYPWHRISPDLNPKFLRNNI